MDADQIPSTGESGWYQDFRDTDGSVLKDRVECDNKFCSNESDFYITTKCCNKPTLSCRPCLSTFLAIQEKRQSEGYTNTCDNCGHRDNPMDMFNKVKKLKLESA